MTTRGRLPSSEYEATHAPVLPLEIVRLLAPRAGGVYVDCTVGLGGHAAALLEAGAGRVIGLDRDPEALARTRARLGDGGGRLELVHADYRQLRRVLGDRGVTGVDGAMADLGVSSMQLDEAARGFGFRATGPLDMRMDQSQGATLAQRLAAVDAATLADVIWRHGEERHSRRVARAVLAARDAGTLTDTAALAAVIRRAVGARGWQRIDPATRTFQALRIWVNDELDGLDRFLGEAVDVLVPRGRLAVIAFHSLEDRVVKHTFRRLAADGVVTLLTRRPLTPDDAELQRNVRSRSARLRAVEKAA